MSNKHKWKGPVDDRECGKCGVRRRGDRPETFQYQQWWGGWFPIYPPCAPIEVRKAKWKETKSRAEYEYAVGLVIKDRDRLRDIVQRAIVASDETNKKSASDAIQDMLEILYDDDA